MIHFLISTRNLIIFQIIALSRPLQLKLASFIGMCTAFNWFGHDHITCSPHLFLQWNLEKEFLKYTCPLLNAFLQGVHNLYFID